MTSLIILNPATNEPLRELAVDAPDDVTRKVALAHAGQRVWANTPLEARLVALSGFRDRVSADRDRLAAITASEVGKPIAQAKNEIQALGARVDFFLENAQAVLADEVVFSEQQITERISHDPLGVVANVSAWNYPYFVGANVFIPALAAGNAVAYKPSEYATLTGLAIAEALHAAGVPEDVFVPIVGAGATGAALVAGDVDAVFFTGSYSTGRKISEAAGRGMRHVQLELGGKDPVFVADDADPAAAAAATADGAFYNTGQGCCSVERIYVHAKIYDAFVEAFLEEVRGFVVGDPMDAATYIGPLTRRPQLDLLDAQVADARARGAKIALGGARLDRPGNYFAPTVVLDVDHSMQVMRDESFGPIVGIQRVGDDEEATRMMNDTAYGLTAGVYSQDGARAEGILRELNAGSVYWNCCDRVSPRLPWSGRGHSGLGVTLSKYGFLAMTRPKAWHLRR